MTVSAMRARLIAYLNDADDKKIKGLYSVLEGDLTGNSTVSLTAKEIEFLDKERELHLQGKSLSYTWDATKDIIRKRKAS